MAEQYQRFSQLFARKATTSDPIGHRVDASGRFLPVAVPLTDSA
jgi:hypothetical protein